MSDIDSSDSNDLDDGNENRIVNLEAPVNTPQPQHVSESEESFVDDPDVNNVQNNQPLAQPSRQQRQPAIIRTWGDCTETVRQFPFTAISGLQTNFNSDIPISVFEQFLTDDVLDLIVNETNRFADDFLSNNELGRRSMMRKWQICDRNEMRRFLGVVMIMGMCPLPHMRL